MRKIALKMGDGFIDRMILHRRNDMCYPESIFLSADVLVDLYLFVFLKLLAETSSYLAE